MYRLIGILVMTVSVVGILSPFASAHPAHKMPSGQAMQKMMNGVSNKPDAGIEKTTQPPAAQQDSKAESEDAKSTRKVSDSTVQKLSSVNEQNILVDSSILWPVHAVLMVLSVFFFGLAIYLARWKKSDRTWLVRHRTIGMVVSWFFLTGVLTAVYMVTGYPPGHPVGIHGWIGFVVSGAVLLMPFLGLAQLRKWKGPQLVRKFHVWLGRVVFIALIATVVLGIVTIIDYW